MRLTSRAPANFLLSPAGSTFYQWKRLPAAESWLLSWLLGVFPVLCRLCYMYLKQFDRAIDSFQNANSIQRHDSTFMQVIAQPKR